MAKFEEGKKTGGEARKLIRRLDRKMTQDAIGKAVNRSGSTIGQIKNGGIDNPPKSLVKRLRTVANKRA